MNKQAPDWYLISDVDLLDSPALVFYEDRILNNISRLIASVDQINRLRPHVKTHKTREIILLMLGAGIRKFKCATIAEAEMLGSCRVPDVLLAYQPVGPKLMRFIALMKAFPDTLFSCLVDHKDAVSALSSAAIYAGINIRVFIDLNVGMNRTGILPGQESLSLYRQASEGDGLEVIGLHAYDGHIHDASLAVRKREWTNIVDEITKLKSAIIDMGLPEPVIVAGGTPTFPLYAQLTTVECSPGTFVLWDKGYQDAFAEQDFEPAALLVSRVISVTAKNRITVDLGHKAVAAENELGRRVHFLNAPAAKMVSQSEEHLVLELDGNHNFVPGDVLYGLPVHICPTVALYERATVIADHQITREWRIVSRDRKINI